MSAEGYSWKKPVKGAAVRPVLCFCGHTEAAHDPKACTAEGCQCRLYQARSCTCGHSYKEHAAVRCGDKGCKCKAYRRDDTAEFLLRMGVRAGQWQFATTAQLRFLMRPGEGRTEATRVYACGLLHAIGQRRRLAVKFNASNQPVPLTPGDVVNELNALDPLEGMTRQHVRRALVDLERQGAARVAGTASKGGRRLFFYAKPLPSRDVPTEPQIVANPGYNESASDSNIDNLREIEFSRIRNTIVKIVSRAIRELLAAEAKADGREPRFVPDAGYKEAIQEAVEEAVKVLRAGYNRLANVPSGGPAYKEDSGSSNSGSVGKPSSSVTPLYERANAMPTIVPSAGNQDNTGTEAIIQTMAQVREPDDRFVPVAPPVNASAASLSEAGSVIAALLHYATAVDDDAAGQLIRKCRREAPDATVDEIVEFVHRKGRQISRGVRNPIGLMLTAVPLCFAPESLRQFRAARRVEAEQAVERQRREAAATAAQAADADLEEQAHVAWEAMPDEEKRRRVSVATAQLKASPHWKLITPEMRQEQAEARARSTLRSELADERVGQA